MSLIDKHKFIEENTAITKYLNNVIGFISFTLGLTSLAFDSPVKIAWVCLPIILILFFLGKDLAGEAKALNKLARETKDKEVIEEKQATLGYKSLVKDILKCPMYIYGMLFYLSILFNTGIVALLKT